MSENSFGRLLRVTTWGESHGPAIGCVIDGCPPRLKLSEEDIQPWLDKRRPGQSRYTTQRREADQVRILSGVFEGQTTGTPISLMIENTDQRSKDYGEIAQQYRPGHADIAYDLKYGIRDYRGGGRSSARETAMRVAAGAVARVILRELVGPQLVIRGALTAIGHQKVDHTRWAWDEVERNPFFSPDAAIVPQWSEQLEAVRKSGSSIGATLEVVAEGVPAGLGAPVYGKLDAELAGGLMGINGIKAVEIGDGMAVAALHGHENADPIRPSESPLEPVFLSNHAGGILGGISTGQPIVARMAIKPTSSILIPVPSINRAGEAVDVMTKGRHDPCIGIRAVPVAEAMVACILADQLLRNHAQCGWL
ncbi:chorismate synthase [Bombella saccharophila]|uniref:Chorismate synthase n=1 Tax=Bombella saccharophila TaxID=2967338 RepID=A0ABT3W576_9PROT|nr:chorismate synthase [Bombella saccharophila]MCX5614227.1 chorismate synthase [Bombella saccharophila]PHI95310.1 chorismate synthase [Parasaccharibacter apium]